MTMKHFNEIVAEFDRVTHYRFDRVTDVAELYRIAKRIRTQVPDWVVRGLELAWRERFDESKPQ